MKMRRYLFIGLIVLLLGLVPLSAQQEPADPPTNPETAASTTDSAAVSDDAVNEVASRMYCPICEMEPLHTCRAQTCIDWRQVIREQLAAGQTEDEIITYFVNNYGDRVVGIPADDGLRLFSFAGPLVMSIVALVFAFFTFQSWQRRNELVVQSATGPTEDVHDNKTSNTTNDADTDYRNQLESDLLH